MDAADGRQARHRLRIYVYRYARRGRLVLRILGRGVRRAMRGAAHEEERSNRSGLQSGKRHDHRTRLLRHRYGSAGREGTALQRAYGGERYRTAVFLALYQRRGQGSAMERRLDAVRLGAERRQGHDAAAMGTPEQLRRGPAAAAATHERARIGNPAQRGCLPPLRHRPLERRHRPHRVPLADVLRDRLHPYLRCL